MVEILLIPRISFFLTFLLIPLLLWTGCTVPRRASPARPPTPAPAKVEVQSWLLKNAHEHYAEGHYDETIRILHTLIERYPNSPLLIEAHWWLANSYEHTGDLPAALAEYRLVVTLSQAEKGNRSRYSRQAKRRVAALTQAVGKRKDRQDALVGVQVPAELIPPAGDLEGWIRSISRQGITVLVLQAGTGEAEDGYTTNTANGSSVASVSRGAYFRTSWATLVRDLFGQVVPIAHRHGVRVFAAVTLRQMDWLDPQLGWADRVYDRGSQTLRSSDSLDLLNPAFQEYLNGFLIDLTATGVDGLLFRASAPSGPGQGLTPYGVAGFKRDFGVTLDPDELARASARTVVALRSGEGHASGRFDDYPPEFWRWAGWKTREMLDVMGKLMQALRHHKPALEFALEFHAQVVTDPVEALVQYSEDLLEAKRHRFDYFLVDGQQLRARPRPAAEANGSTTMGLQDDSSGPDQLSKLIGDARRTWIGVALSKEAFGNLSTSLQPEMDRANLKPKVGIIYLTEPLSVP